MSITTPCLVSFPPSSSMLYHRDQMATRPAASRRRTRTPHTPTHEGGVSHYAGSDVLDLLFRTRDIRDAYIYSYRLIIFCMCAFIYSLSPGNATLSRDSAAWCHRVRICSRGMRMRMAHLASFNSAANHTVQVSRSIELSCFRAPACYLLCSNTHESCPTARYVYVLDRAADARTIRSRKTALAFD